MLRAESLATLIALFATGTAGVVAQVTAPMDSTYERLGVAGLMVVAAFFALRWMSAQLDKKDARIEAITASMIAATDKNTDRLVECLECANDTQLKVVDAMNKNSGEIAAMRSEMRRGA